MFNKNFNVTYKYSFREAFLHFARKAENQNQYHLKQSSDATWPVLACFPTQLDELIERTEREYMQSQLPSDLSQAESMLEQHKRKKTEISQLINFTNEEGENIVTRVRQQVSKDFWEIQQFAVLWKKWCQCTEFCRVLEDFLFWNRVTVFFLFFFIWFYPEWERTEVLCLVLELR